MCIRDRLFSVPFALLRNTLNITNNPVGLDATIAWYGLGFFLYAVFDFAFLTAFYKNGYKVGKSFILAAGPVVLFMAAIEAASHIPALVWMDSCQPKHLLMQLPVLTAGIFCYSIFIPLAYRISIKRFEKVDL